MGTKDRTVETTIALPEALHTRVRVIALRSRVSMRRWIQEAIEARLVVLRSSTNRAGGLTAAPPAAGAVPATDGGG